MKTAFINDTQYSESTLTSYNVMKDGYWEINTNYGSMCVPKIRNFKPEAGMVVRFYGKGIGQTVRGVTIDDKVSFYRTIKQDEDKFKKDQAEQVKIAKKKYEKIKKSNQAIINKLPIPFQKRIETFKKNNPDFGWKFEGYELFTCEEAVKIANKFKTIEEIDRFRNMDYAGQRKLLDVSDAHSGNTFGCSILLAKVFLTNPDNVVNIHGAMCPLVGCADYGCNIKKEKNENR